SSCSNSIRRARPSAAPFSCDRQPGPNRQGTSRPSDGGRQLSVQSSAPVSKAVGAARPAWLRRFTRNGSGMFGLVGVVLVLLMALGAGLLSPHDPARQYFDGLTLQGDPLPPSRQFLFGTDTLGRDLLSRILHGARVSLLVGVLANGAAVLLGLI